MSILIDKFLQTNIYSFEQILSIKGKVYTFLNPVSYLDALKHKEMFSQFDGIFVDGNLLVKAIKAMYGKSIERRSFDMTSLAPELFKYAGAHGKTIYIVASRQEQVETAVKIFTDRFPKVQIIGYRNGFFTHDRNMDEEARYICKVNPDYLIVGMGALNQEKFLLKVKDAGFKGIGFTCGGFIHQTSQNEIDYYPMWVDKANLRFIYRMWKEPHTRVRYIKAGILFPIRFFIERIFG